MTDRTIDIITGYHAHIYYDDQTRDIAGEVRKALDHCFDVVLGRWRDEPVGPHPVSMYQVAFDPALFDKIVPWLALNRRGLVIFIHPNTDDAYLDHAEHALWLGKKLDLKLKNFEHREDF